MTQSNSSDPPSANRPVHQKRHHDEVRSTDRQLKADPAMIGRTLTAIGGIIALVGGVLALVGLVVALARLLFAYEPLIAVGLAVLVGGAILLVAGELVRGTTDPETVDPGVES